MVIQVQWSPCGKPLDVSRHTRMTCLMKILYVFISVLIISCEANPPQLSRSDRDVMKEILPMIIDSMFVEITYEMTPPPVMSIDSTSSEVKLILGKKDLGLKEEIRQSFIKGKELPRVIIMVIDDIIQNFNESELDKIPYDCIQGKDSLKFAYRMDLRSISVEDGVKLIPSPYYTPCSEPDPHYLVLSKFEFSRIAINKEFTTGMLTCKYDCGLGCGLGYRIFIKRNDIHWEIDKIIFEYTE
jgi:hypothetical protein